MQPSSSQRHPPAPSYTFPAQKAPFAAQRPANTYNNIQQILFHEALCPEKTHPLRLFSDECKDEGNVLEILISQIIIIMQFFILPAILSNGEKNMASE